MSRKMKWLVRCLMAVSVLFAGSLLWSGCAPLVEFETVQNRVGRERFVEVDGRQVYVERAGSGEPAVVLLHGFAASSYTFRDVIPALSESNRVLAIDWHGFGWTQRPKDRDAYSPAGQVAMIRSVLEQEGVRRAHLVGHSFGGVLANLYAETYPESVASLILISPPVEFQKLPWLLNFWLGRAISYPFLRSFISNQERFADMQRRGYYEADQVAENDLEEYRQRLLVEDLWSALHGFLSGEAPASDQPRYGISGVPLFVLVGRHDPIVRLTDVKLFFKNQPNATLLILDHSGHNAPEEEPDLVAENLIRFFQAAE